MLCDVLILSLVEGLTEFLPISSTGHLLIVSEWLKMDKEFAKVFDVAIQLGAIVAVIFLYPNFFKGMLSKSFFKSSTAKVMIAAIMPVLVIGFFSHSFIKNVLFSTKLVFIALIIGGIVLIIADIVFKDRKQDAADKKNEITLKQGLLIGFFQCLALCPGVSRSGATMIGGLIAGQNIVTSASFSFIIAVPVMTLAIGYDLLASASMLTLQQLGWIVLGMVCSFVIAYGCMKWFLSFIQKQGLYLFGIYRIIVGVIGLVVIL